MTYKEHLLEIWIEGKKVELEDQKVNLRFDNILFDPTKITSTDASYSFSFDIPATPNNNKIFNYANDLASLNKFHQRYKTDVYADGTLIFDGTLVLNSYKDKKYNVNLVSVKQYSLDDIFGDMTMSEIKWKIPFEGAGNGTNTIDYYNSLADAKVTFPFVSYGAFQKSPYLKDEVRNEYTSKFDMDEYNRWYVESFYPSPNVMETIRKAFETRGYTVGGDAFYEPNLTNIFMSANIASDQAPDYNIGNPKFGQVSLSTSYNSTQKGTGYQQELQFPYFELFANGATGEGITSSTEYNFSTIDIYDLLSSGATVNVDSTSYMYQPNENVIVIPADGFYKIEMSVNSTLNNTGTITAKQYLFDVITRELSEQDIELPVGFQENTPIEIQLVRNYNDNVELIKGKNNKKYINGNPNESHYVVNGVRYDNVKSWQTCFPHEDPYNAEMPTKTNDLTSQTNQPKYIAGKRNDPNTQATQTEPSDNEITNNSGNFVGYRGGKRTNRTRGYDIDTTTRHYYSANYGYVNRDGEIMCFDQAVSDSFICGFSSMLGGTASVMKNGYSWSPINAIKNESFYSNSGYLRLIQEDRDAPIIQQQTTFHKEDYGDAPATVCTVTDTGMTGSLACIVYLNKNDVLSLFEIHRAHNTAIGNDVVYGATTNVNLKITAFSPRHYDRIKAEELNVYDSPVEFDADLNIGNFLNKETKVSDWLQNVADAFNLQITQNAYNVSFDTKKKRIDIFNSAVDIDNKTNDSNAESSRIEYPRSMAVKYKIDTDEWGAERSAVENAGSESILNDDNWKNYIDSGYTPIMLNDDSYVSTTSDKSLPFSYTWYQNFNWYPVDSTFTKLSDTPITLNIPCISKYSYMIDGYDYEESMKHDGYELAQRFWFRPEATSSYVWTRTYPVQKVTLYKPVNAFNEINLSYKTSEISLLTKFFNIQAYLASNYVEVEVYLTPDEYNMIKAGSLVHFDSDLYIPVEINAYDPSGYDPTTLKLLKKIN